MEKVVRLDSRRPHSFLNVPLGKMWKVPFRSVYATTFSGWVKETIFCHLVLRFYAEELKD